MVSAERRGISTSTKGQWDVGICLFGYPRLRVGSLGLLTWKILKASVSGRVQRGVFAARSRRIKAIKRSRSDTDRPVRLIVGSSKFGNITAEVGFAPVVRGSRCHLDCRSQDQQRADDGKGCSLHGRLRWLDLEEASASPCGYGILMRANRPHQLAPT